MPTSKLKRRFKLLVVLALLSSPLFAQRPRIRLDSVFPPGSKAGTETTVTILGELSDAATDLVFSNPGIEATQQISPSTEYTVAHRKPRVFDVRVAEDVPNGRYEVRAVGAIGLSAPRLFTVSRLTEKKFDAGKNSRANPFAISIGEVANAVGRNDQRDYYKFFAKQGESVLVQVWADRIDSNFDAEITVYGPDGKRVSRVRQSQSNDPMLTLLPPLDGEYLVEVWDATYRGGSDYFYRLEVSNRSQVEAIHPVVAKEKENAEYTIYGFNLPGGLPVSGVAGNLQSRTIEMTPDFASASFAAALPLGQASAARIDGGSVALPVPLSTNHVFMARAKHGVTVEQSNDSLASAQSLSVPVDVAGQFYPRRDVDWYRFDAKKGQTFRIALNSQQLGTNADPILRVGRIQESEDGEPKLTKAAESDDLEGSPKNRESRKFFTGSVDGTYRFTATEDGAYAISAADHYNTKDDPRLVYHLSISPESNDFSLLAYAEPERHGDVKIVKPNGVSLSPGGVALVRVRLLPHPGFRGEVTIAASRLPGGVKSHPLTLSKNRLEGLLTLTAAKDVSSQQVPIEVIGTATTDGKATRVAKVGVVKRANNNVDQAPAKVRLASNLMLAVTDAPAEPIAFDPLTDLVTSVGAKLKLPVRFSRDESFKDKELQVESDALPNGFKVNAAKTKTGFVELQTELQKPSPGRYAVSLASKVKSKRPRNLVQVREAESDLKKVSELLTQHEDAVALRQSVMEKLKRVSSSTIGAERQAEAAAKQPRMLLESNLQELQKLATTLGEQLKASASDVGNEALSAAVDKTQEQLAARRAEGKTLRSKLAEAAQPLKALQDLRAAEAKEIQELEKELASLGKKRDETKQKKTEAEKRLADAKKNQLEKEVEYYVYAPPVQIQVLPSPLVISAAGKDVKRGATVDVPVSIQRQFGFRGTVQLTATAPNGSGLSSTTTVVGPGQSLARVAIHAGDKAKVGKQRVKLETRIKFNGVDIQDRKMIDVKVVANDDAQSK